MLEKKTKNMIDRIVRDLINEGIIDSGFKNPVYTVATAIYTKGFDTRIIIILLRKLLI